MCEACTVRYVVDRELGHPGDLWLLQLERVRTLDMAHYWAARTHQQYQSRIRSIKRFEQRHPGLLLLQKAQIKVPPGGADVTLMWAELDTSVRPTKRSAKSDDPKVPVFGTIRGLRSAVSQYHTWDTIMQHPMSYFSSGTHLVGPCRPTDGASFTLFAKGFSSRIGDNPNPATALLGRHIQSLDMWFRSQIPLSTGREERWQWALAGLANLLLWLGWLRSGELFELRWGSLHVILPRDGPRHDLPAAVGAILLQLTAETKSNRVANADVIMAYTTLSGLSPGAWIHRLLPLIPARYQQGLIFVHPTGTPWSSRSYRINYLYPGLARLRGLGDPFLMSFDDKRGNTLADKFWSLHSYRRGARTHCQRKRPERYHRKATHVQVYEHARWRLKRSGEAVDVLYREWTLYERLRITLQSH